MSRILIPALWLLASPAIAHEDGFHLHPHGIDTAWFLGAAGLVLVVLLLAHFRGRT